MLSYFSKNFYFIGTLSVGCFIISASGGLYVNCISLLIMGATNCGPDSLLGGSISMEVSFVLVFPGDATVFSLEYSGAIVRSYRPGRFVAMMGFSVFSK